MNRYLVEAGAGCGKTYNLVQTYQDLLLGKNKLFPGSYHAKDILTLTFTKDAAQEMRSRIKDKLPEDLHLSSNKDIQISTFHSFCYQLISDYGNFSKYSNFDSLYDQSVINSLQRKKFQQFFFNHPEHKKLLKHLTLNDVRNITFSNEVLMSQNIKGFYQKQILIYKEQQEKLLFELKNAVYPDNLSDDCWPKLLQSSLSAINTINFNKGKGIRNFAKLNPELLNIAKEYKEFALSPYFNFFKKIDDCNIEIDFYSLLENFVTDYRNSINNEFLSYDTLEQETLELIRSNEEIKNKYKIIIIDEFQDCSPRQINIINELSNEKTGWYLVGDPKQSIYYFRDADLRLFKKVKDLCQLIKLETNYRSSSKVLEYTNKIQNRLFSSKHIYNAPKQSLLSSKTNDDINNTEITYKTYTTDEKDLIPQFVLQEFLKHSDKKIGILCPNWTQLFKISEHLNTHDIQHKTKLSSYFLEHHLTELFITYLLYLKDNTNSEHLVTLKKWGYTNDCFPESATNLSEVLQSFVQDIKAHRWPHYSKWLSLMEHNIHQMETQNALNKYDTSSYYDFLIQNIDQFTSPSLSNNADKQIDLMTIHGSKGLEFDHLILPYLYEKQTPLHLKKVLNKTIQFKYNTEHFNKFLSPYAEYQKREENLQIEYEKNRLFYVALTRAKYSISLYLNENTFTPKTPSKTKPHVLDFIFGAKNKAHYWKNYLDENDTVIEQCALEANEQINVEEPSTPLPTNEIFHYKAITAMNSPSTKQTKETLSQRSQSIENSINFGNQLHFCLEHWNGKPEQLKKTAQDLASENYNFNDFIGFCLSNQNPDWLYFQDTLNNHPQNVLRELPIYYEDKQHSLNGIIDCLLIDPDNSQKATILDWKTSLSQTQLSDEKLEKYFKQLFYYKSSLKKQFKLISIKILFFSWVNDTLTIQEFSE